MSDYKFKKINKNLLVHLLSIFEDAFGNTPSLKYLENKHETSFSGHADIGFLAYDSEETPVGFYGVFPLLASIRGETQLIAQSGDTMVKKKHGGRGLFSKLAKETYKLCTARKIKAVFGFPSETSYPGFTRNLNWQHNENLHKYHFFVPTIPIYIVFRRHKFLKNIYENWMRFILGFFKVGSPFESSIMKDGQDCIIHDADFWNYKLKNDDIHLIKIFNSQAAIKMTDFIEIGDLQYSNKIDFYIIISVLYILGFFGGSNFIKFYCSPGCQIDRDMRTLRKPKIGLPIGFINLDQNIDVSNLKFTYIDFDTF